MIFVKFDYNADTTLATYTLLKDGEMSMQPTLELYLSYSKAHDLVKLMDLIIELSSQDTREVLLGKLESFISSQKI